MPDDAAAVAEVFLAARKTSLPWLAVVHDDDDVRGWIADTLLPSGSVTVATAGGQVVGFLAVGDGWVDHLYVHPDHHGRGIGSLLLDRAKAREPGGLQLWTFQRNALARRFYEARGFVAVELTEGTDNEEREPDVRYVWRPD